MLDLFTQLDDHQGKSHVEVEFALGIGVEPTMSAENDLAVKKLQAEVNKIHAETACLHAKLEQRPNAGARIQREKAELDKLKAETTKFNEETKKLQGEKRVWRRENAIAFFTALSMGASIIIAFFTFLGQQSDRDKFNVTKAVIELVDKLRTSSDGSYAILLSAYEEHAVPILLISLNKVGSETFVTGVTEALRLIAEKKPNDVIPMLNNRTRSIFKAVTAGDAPKVEPLLNHIGALGNLRKLGSKKAWFQVGSKNESEITLSELYKELKCSEKEKLNIFKVDPDHRTSICIILEKANPVLGKRDG